MNALIKITTTELKLYLRTPTWPLLGILFPSIILLVVGMIPGMGKPYPTEGGPRFIDVWAPSLIVLTVTMLGLQVIPAYPVGRQVVSVGVTALRQPGDDHRFLLWE